ncbi:hypothetical protein BSTEL_1766 [Bifidobacterium stellenboschense]|uniref:Uncharacterized protein n=1 Tax=Bifidobacterium stellenboschense TaxID=762211 RepID=A0A087DMV7_9BIFI|nr:hypothetical protein BSTEL_1766 [Bifidobacterium stellenboschense]
MVMLCEFWKPAAVDPSFPATVSLTMVPSPLGTADAVRFSPHVVMLIPDENVHEQDRSSTFFKAKRDCPDSR